MARAQDVDAVLFTKSGTDAIQALHATADVLKSEDCCKKVVVLVLCPKDCLRKYALDTCLRHIAVRLFHPMGWIAACVFTLPDNCLVTRFNVIGGAA